jgi:hypothetical protein
MFTSSHSPTPSSPFQYTTIHRNVRPVAHVSTMRGHPTMYTYAVSISTSVLMRLLNIEGYDTSACV